MIETQRNAYCLKERVEVMKNSKLADTRKNSGLTQSYVAENVGITVTSYQRIEYGKQRPTLTTAIKIAEVLHSTVEELFK